MKINAGQTSAVNTQLTAYDSLVKVVYSLIIGRT